MKRFGFYLLAAFFITAISSGIEEGYRKNYPDTTTIAQTRSLVCQRLDGWVTQTNGVTVDGTSAQLVETNFVFVESIAWPTNLSVFNTQSEQRMVFDDATMDTLHLSLNGSDTILAWSNDTYLIRK